MRLSPGPHAVDVAFNALREWKFGGISAETEPGLHDLTPIAADFCGTQAVALDSHSVDNQGGRPAAKLVYPVAGH